MKKSFRDSAPVWALFSVPVIYFALAAATVYEPGMSLLRLLPAVTELGLGRVRWTEYSMRAILLSLSAYVGGIALY